MANNNEGLKLGQIIEPANLSGTCRVTGLYRSKDNAIGEYDNYYHGLWRRPSDGRWVINLGIFYIGGRHSKDWAGGLIALEVAHNKWSEYIVWEL